MQDQAKPLSRQQQQEPPQASTGPRNPWQEQDTAKHGSADLVTKPAPAPAAALQPAPQQQGGQGGVSAQLGATTLLIICYNRPEYLQRTIKSVSAAFPAEGGPHVLLSQDGQVASVSAAVQQAPGWLSSAPQRRGKPVSFEHIQHSQALKPGDDRSGYGALARHFGFALTHAFSRPGTDTVIILEDDLEVAPDFFEYFAAMVGLLRSDKSLLAASAYNDMGQRSNVGDPGRALRSDFFPGLGWMLHKRVWEELQPIWPSAYWDDWLREPAQRQGETRSTPAMGRGPCLACRYAAHTRTHTRTFTGRHVIHPEVSRTRTFGEKGVSQAQFFQQYLGNIHLNSVSVQWTALNLRYLGQGEWDADLQTVLAAAQSVPTVAAFQAKTCQQLYAGVLEGSVVLPAHHNWLPPRVMRDAQQIQRQAVMLTYRSNREYEAFARVSDVYAHAVCVRYCGSWLTVACNLQQLGIITDIKANVPRTAYHGVVPLRHNGCLKLLIPATAV